MKKKIKFIYIIFVLISTITLNKNCFAQLTKEDKLDSLYAVFIKDSLRIYKHSKVSLIIAGDKRNTFIQTNTKTPVELIGGQIGVSINEKHDVGLGFYSISNVRSTHSISDQNKTLHVNLKMQYTTLFYEYTFIDTRYWEIGFPLELGSGSYQTTVTDSAGKRAPEFKDTLKRNILLLGAGLNVDFKLIRWLGINAMGGYRLVGGNEPNKVNFNGVFYSVGIHFYVGEFIRTLRLMNKRIKYIQHVTTVHNLPD